MVGSARRSRAALAEALTEWFRDGGGGGPAREVSEVREAPEVPEVTVQRPQPGLSSDTLFVDVSRESGRERLVVRLPPAGEASFPDYSLSRQAAMQNALFDAGLPVAGRVTVELDASLLGAPFVVMPRIEGRFLTTYPSFIVEGWLAESPPPVQRRAFEAVLDGMVAVHQTRVDGVEMTGGGPELEGMLDYWSTYLDWCGADDAASAVYRVALDWCRARVPADPAESVLLWGDPQPTNVVFDDAAEIAALLDWEMATAGPGEVDLAWLLVLQEHANDTAGATMPGYPGRAALIERYEQAVGRPVADLHWYEVFANIRSGAIVLRLGELMAAGGRSRSWTEQVPQRRYLEQMLAVAS